jgi:hypothetical protein
VLQCRRIENEEEEGNMMKQKREKMTTENTKVMSIRLYEDEYQTITKLAEQEQRSKNNMIRVLLQIGLKYRRKEK